MTYAALRAAYLSAVHSCSSHIVVVLPAAHDSPHRRRLGCRRRVLPGLMGPIVGGGADACGRPVVYVELQCAEVHRVLERRGVA